MACVRGRHAARVPRARRLVRRRRDRRVRRSCAARLRREPELDDVAAAAPRSAHVAPRRSAPASSCRADRDHRLRRPVPARAPPRLRRTQRLCCSPRSTSSPSARASRRGAVRPHPARLAPLRSIGVLLARSRRRAVAALVDAPLAVLVPALVVAGVLSMAWNGLAFAAAAEAAGARPHRRRARLSADAARRRRRRRRRPRSRRSPPARGGVAFVARRARARRRRARLRGRCRASGTGRTPGTSAIPPAAR